MPDIDEVVRAFERQTQILEASLTSLAQVVSYDDELWDAKSGELWTKIGLSDLSNAAASSVYTTEAKLTEVRGISRYLCQENPFAINAVENRISYTVGQGHTYEWEAKPGVDVDEPTRIAARDWLDDWLQATKWHDRQQEISRRMDRDGEVFLRYFVADGQLVLRFVEPEQIRTPGKLAGNPDVRFGILFEPGDAELPLVYYVHPNGTEDDAEEVPADQIQHRKANADSTAPRGIPLFWPVRQNLIRADKLLRNMGHLAAMRSAIAMIRKHASGSAAAVTNYLSQMADAKTTDESGAQTNYKMYSPGTIIDHGTASEYEFPSHRTDVASFVEVLQAELRAISSRLVMPEFMLSSDASNANYASTMVAEGPAVKMFERLQAAAFEYDREVIERAAMAADMGRVLERLQLTAEFPQVRTRDRQKEVSADKVLVECRAMSLHTMAARAGLDYDEERVQMDDEGEAAMERMPSLLPGSGGGDDDDEGDGDLEPDEGGTDA